MTFINAFVQADREIGFINVKGKGHPPRICLGGDLGIGSSTVAYLMRNCENGQTVFTGTGSHAYRIYFPRVVYLRALELQCAAAKAQAATASSEAAL